MASERMIVMAGTDERDLTKLAEYEGLKRLDVGDQPRGPWSTLEAGIRHTQTAIEFWEEQRGKRRRRG